MSPGAGNGASFAPQPIPFAAPAHVRLKVEQASYAYSATDRSAPKFTLGPVSFEAQQRELVAILGPNASGKSTLLKMLAGLLKPLSGRVEVDGKEVSEIEPRDARAAGGAGVAGKRAAFSVARVGIRAARALSLRQEIALRVRRRLPDGGKRACASGRGLPCATAGWISFPAAKSNG